MRLRKASKDLPLAWSGQSDGVPLRRFLALVYDGTTIKLFARTEDRAFRPKIGPPELDANWDP